MKILPIKIIIIVILSFYLQSIQAQSNPLNGNYTIGNSSDDFDSFQEAVDSLIKNGVNGPVIFTVRNGIYYEEIYIPEIYGTSASNTITFISEDIDSNRVTFYSSDPADTTNYIVCLDGADYIRFTGIGFLTMGESSGRVFDIRNGATGNIISRSLMNGNNDSISVVYLSGSGNHYNKFSGNRIFDGSIGIENEMSEETFLEDILIEGNEFQNQDDYGILLYHTISAVIERNSFASNSLSEDEYRALQIENATGMWRIVSNKINAVKGINGIRILESHSTGSDEGIIANNFIAMGSTIGVSGLNIESSGPMKVYNNSFHVTSNYQDSRCMHVFNPEQLSLLNNNFCNTGGEICMYLESTDGIVSWDYNNLYSTGENSAILNDTYLSFKDLQGIGLDTHSVSADPYYVSGSDLHARQSALVNTGTPVEEVQVDIDGEPRDIMHPNIGADEFQIPDADAGIVALARPKAPFPEGTYNVYVVLQNHGYVPLYSVEILSIINSFPLEHKYWLGELEPGETDTVYIDDFVFNMGTEYHFICYTENPNNNPDPLPENDTFKLDHFYTEFGGEYLLGGEYAHFTTFNDAVTALENSGVWGPVNIYVADGTYAEQVGIGSIPGASDENTIAFISQSLDSSKVILTFDKSPTLYLTNTSSIRFQQITIEMTDLDLSSVITARTAHDITFSNCIIRVLPEAYGYQLVWIRSGYDNFKFLNNRVENGQNGLVLRNNTDDYSSNLHIEGNLFINQGGSAITCGYISDHAVIRNNMIQSTRSLSNAISYGNSLGSFIIEKNKVEAQYVQSPFRGITVSNFDGDSDYRGLIINNFVAAGHSSETNALSIQNSHSVDVYNNNFYCQSGSGTDSRTGNISGCTDINLLNNIFANGGSGYAVYVESGENISFSDHNDFFTNGDILGFWEVPCSTLTTLQAQSTWDEHSISADPLFYSETNLHVSEESLNGNAMSIDEVLDDIDGDPRHLTNPDIGADEFNISTNDLRMENILSPVSGCTDSPMEITVRIINIGTDPQSGFDVGFVLNDTLEVTENVGELVVAPLDSLVYTFKSQVNMPDTDVTYLIDAYVSFNGDANPANNHFGKTIEFLHLPAKPVITYEGELTRCLGDNIRLHSNVNARWSTTEYSNSILVRHSGSYFQEVHSSENGCNSYSDTMIVLFVDKPELVGETEQLVCEGDTVEFTIHNAMEILWSSGLTDSIIGFVPDADTTLTFVAKNTDFCILADTIHIDWASSEVPGVVSGMLPEDNGSVSNPSVTLSWLPDDIATSYDIYIWDISTPKPAEPTIPGHDGIFVQRTLQSGKTFNWQVVSRTVCQAAPSAVQTFTLEELPNLQITFVNNSQGYSGQDMEVTWTVANTGVQPTGNSNWYDRIWISQDIDVRTGDAEDIYLGMFVNNRTLNGGDSYTSTATVRIPPQISGTFYLFVITDAIDALDIDTLTMKCRADHGGSLIRESDEHNNFNYKLFAIDPVNPPDLQVDSVKSGAMNAFSGSALNISYKVINEGGSGTYATVWQEEIYLADSMDFEHAEESYLLASKLHSGVLAAGEFYKDTIQLKLPEGIQGIYYLHVFTDTKNDVFEGVYDGNNSGISDSVNVIRISPNMELTDIQGPDTANNKEIISVIYSVLNSGHNTSALSRWTDKIGIVTFNHDTIWGTWNSRSGEINTLESYTDTVAFYVPDSISGLCYLCARTNFNNSLYEYTLDDNIRCSENPISVLSADMVITNIQTDSVANSGQNIYLIWNTMNQGEGKATGTWFDGIYLSESNVLDINQAIKLNAFASVSELEAGQNKPMSSEVKLPDGIQGNYYLFVESDIYDIIFENDDENNNTSAALPIRITLSPSVDLLPVSVDLPDTIEIDIPFTIEYKVGNLGTSMNRKLEWTDNFYLYSGSTLDISKASLISSIDNTYQLDSADEAVFNFETRISDDVKQGNYHLYIMTDAFDQNYESLHEDNNILQGKQVFVKSCSPVDYAVTSFSVPATGYSSMPVNITVKVTNLSATTSKGKPWEDALYLSKDTVWEGTDLLLGSWRYLFDLEKDKSYNYTNTVLLPDTAVGDYYFIYVADHQEMLHDANRTNNKGLVRNNSGIPIPVNIQFSIPADLSLARLSAPDSGYSGQPINVIWTVANIGEAITKKNKWIDGFYLSANEVVDANDIFIQKVYHTGALSPAGTYTSTAKVYLPVNSEGHYYLLVRTDNDNLEYEHGQESNNIAVKLIDIIKPPASDLEVWHVVPPASAMVSDTISVQVIIKNTSTNVAFGQMRQNIYFSKDTKLDSSDIYAGEKEITINLQPDMQAEDFIDIVVPGLIAGNYYVIALTDAKNNIVEDDEENNSGASEKVVVDMKMLPVNTSITEVLSNNKALYIKIPVPDSLQDESLLLTLESPLTAAVNEMYISHESIPSRITYDHKHSKVQADDQQVLIPSSASGNYYLLAYGYNPSSSLQNIELAVRKLNFEIVSVDPRMGGNSGIVSVEITGSKFYDIEQVQLENDAGNDISSLEIYFVNSSRIIARFDLEGKDPGKYDMVVHNAEGETAIKTDGFEIVAGVKPELSMVFDHPEVARINRIVPMTIRYANTGNVDIEVLERLVISRDGAYLGFTPDGLSNKLTSLRIELSEPGSPLPVIRPGAGGSIVIYSMPKRVQYYRFIITE